MKKELYPGYKPEFSTLWKMGQAWIILPLIPFGLTTWITFGYLAYLLKRWYLWVFALLYTAPIGVAYIHYLKLNPSTIANDFVTQLIYNIVLVAWLLSMVHCAFLWKDYMLACKTRRRKRLGKTPGLSVEN